MRKSLLILMLGLIALFGLLQIATSQEDPHEESEAEAVVVTLSINSNNNCMEGFFTADLTDAERTVDSEQILSALSMNHCVRISGAIIEGDINLNTLPVNGIDDQGEDLATISGALVIRDSQISGKINASKKRGGPRVYFEELVLFDGSSLGDFEANGAIFNRTARFEGTTFSNVRMDRTQFRDGAIFSKATFQNPVFMTRVEVQGNLDFEGAQFTTITRMFSLSLDGSAILEGTMFGGATDLSGWSVSSMNARGAQFTRSARFVNAVWNGPADFSGSVFSNTTDFSNTIYRGQTTFRGARFDNNVRFFNSQFQSRADFSNVHFDTTSTFTGTRFDDEAIFSNATFVSDSVLDGSIFAGIADFSKAQFLSAASFSKTRFDNWSTFADAEFQTLKMTDSLFVSAAGSDWRRAKVNGDFDRSGILKVVPWMMEGAEDPDISEDVEVDNNSDSDADADPDEDTDATHDNDEDATDDTDDEDSMETEVAVVNGDSNSTMDSNEESSHHDAMDHDVEVVVNAHLDREIVLDSSGSKSYVLASLWIVVVIMLIIRAFKAL
jgi:uncharacterized protein YjbI with pentapeptide repeats